jgi:hypothetical protein
MHLVPPLMFRTDGQALPVKPPTGSASHCPADDINHPPIPLTADVNLY